MHSHNRNTTKKQSLYTTAFSPLFNCYVTIERSYQDSSERWIFVGSNKKEELNEHLFREDELTKFCI